MSKGKILLVEDDPDLRRGLVVRLKAWGYNVVTASDGATAIAQARKERPDLILLDLGLPAGDGFDVMESLRKLGILGPVPVIVVSGRDAKVNRPKAIEAGAVAMLTKPVDNDELHRLLSTHLLPAPTSTRTTDGGGRRRILLIEDDADTRLGMMIRLRTSGYDVMQAGDGATAMMLARRDVPDLILLDLGLPAGDGFVLLERIKSNTALATVPVIVVSARDPTINRPNALKAGAVGYFQKPVDNQELLAAIQSALGET